MRKVIQLNHTNHSRREMVFGEEVVINSPFYSALCDDGTMWCLDPFDDSDEDTWCLLPIIPQEENT